jgi:hypothetical protein
VKVFINYFLRAESWALCLMMVAPYLVYKFTTFGHNPVEWGFLVAYFLVVMLGWIYSIGNSANEKLQPELQLPGLLLKVAIAMPFASLAYFVLVILNPLYQGEMTRAPGWLIYLHFTNIAAFGFSIWFAAKQFVTLKLGQQIGFISYYPVFMALWFAPVGVWFLQSRVREVFSRSDPGERTNAG